MLWHNTNFLGSFPDARDCPKTKFPEYAFIGRSNVGKSSLINMLLGKKELARTSKTPGKTQTINLFQVENDWTLADLPGYGYAKVSKTSRLKWQKMIEFYLQNRQQLVCTFVLIDVRHTLQANDKEFIDWLGLKGIPFVLVFTKADKVKPAEKAGNMGAIFKALKETWDPLPQHFVSSANTGEGKEELHAFIDELNTRLKDAPQA